MKKRHTVLAALLALTLAAGACGDSNSDDDNDGATNTTSGESDGAFAVPSGTCPADASEELAAGAPIKLGISLPQSGPLAAFDLIRVGMEIAIKKVNAAGGVDGHQLQLIAKDDAYEPARSKVNMEALIDQDKIFASVGQIGTPNVAGAQGKHEQTCTPQIQVNTGFPAWGDPQTHPWTTGALLSYNTEATIWADYIADQKPGAKVAQLIYNNDFGKAYQSAFEKQAKAKGLSIVATEVHDANAQQSLNNNVSAILAAKPDFVIGGTTGAFCSKLMAGLAADTSYKGQTIISSTCVSTASFFKPIDPAGDGVLVLTSVKDPADPGVANDEDVKEFKADVAKYGTPANANDTTVAAGWVQIHSLVDILTRAAAAEGGLTRINAMNAAWNMDYDAPLLFGPIKIDGNDDAYGVETLEFVKYSAETHSMQFTDIKFDQEGKTGLYVK